MRRGLALLSMALAFFAIGTAAAATPVAAGEREIVVRLLPGSSAAEAARVASATGGTLAASIPQLDAYLLRLPWVRGLRPDPAVQSVEPNAVLRVHGLPSDSLRSLQWSLDAIGIDALWSRTLGDPGVTIAVVDTGVDYTHPELAGRVLLGPDLADGDGDPIDTHGHGTAVAALAAAAADGQGIVGACPACTLMAVKVAPDGSSEITKFTSAAGIVWAADHGADVINLSFGGRDPGDVQRDAVAYARAQGAVVVASAGNRGRPALQYPAAYEGVVAVGASDRNDRPTRSTSFGGWVDLAAPGVTLLAPSIAGGALPQTGTSFAAPLVSGVAGLLKSLLPGSPAEDVTTALLAGTLPLRPPLVGRSRPLARGRLDVPQLLAKLPALGSPTLTIARLAVPMAIEGRRFTVRAAVLRDDTGGPLRAGTVRCEARLRTTQLRAVTATLAGGAARCSWQLPPGSRRRAVSGRISVAAAGFEASHTFTAPVFGR